MSDSSRSTAEFQFHSWKLDSVAQTMVETEPLCFISRTVWCMNPSSELSLDGLISFGDIFSFSMFQKDIFVSDASLLLLES